MWNLTAALAAVVGVQVILIVLGVPGVPAYVVSVAIGIGVLVYVGAGPRH